MLRWREFKSNDRELPSPRKDESKMEKILWQRFKTLKFYRNNQSWHKSLFIERVSKRDDNFTQYIWLLSQIFEPQLSTGWIFIFIYLFFMIGFYWLGNFFSCLYHPWRSISSLENKDSSFFGKGEISDVVKIHWQILKIFFSRTNELVSIKQSILTWREFKFVQMISHTLF